MDRMAHLSESNHSARQFKVWQEARISSRANDYASSVLTYLPGFRSNKYLHASEQKQYALPLYRSLKGGLCWSTFIPHTRSISNGRPAALKCRILNLLMSFLIPPFKFGSVSSVSSTYQAYSRLCTLDNVRLDPDTLVHLQKHF